MERGTNLQDLCRGGQSKTLVFEFEEQEWEVNYHKVDWKLRLNAIENAWKTRKTTNPTTGEVIEDVTFDTAQYYEEMFQEAIIDICGQKVTLPMLRSFDTPVITHLIHIVPGPSLLTDLVSGKKDSGPSSKAS